MISQVTNLGAARQMGLSRSPWRTHTSVNVLPNQEYKQNE